MTSCQQTVFFAEGGVGEVQLRVRLRVGGHREQFLYTASCIIPSNRFCCGGGSALGRFDFGFGFRRDDHVEQCLYKARCIIPANLFFGGGVGEVRLRVRKGLVMDISLSYVMLRCHCVISDFKVLRYNLLYRGSLCIHKSKNITNDFPIPISFFSVFSTHPFTNGQVDIVRTNHINTMIRVGFFILTVSVLFKAGKLFSVACRYSNFIRIIQTKQSNLIFNIYIFTIKTSSKTRRRLARERKRCCSSSSEDGSRKR